MTDEEKAADAEDRLLGRDERLDAIGMPLGLVRREGECDRSFGERLHFRVAFSKARGVPDPPTRIGEVLLNGLDRGVLGPRSLPDPERGENA